MKTKKFLSMAALALVGAMMTGCSNDDDILQPENKTNVVTLTATVGFDDAASTRAVTGTGVKTFAADDQMAVIYKNTSGGTVKAVGTLASGAGTKSGTFTFTLTNPDKTQNVTYIYPAAMAGSTDVDYTKLNSQEGTLTDLGSKYDLATNSGAWNAGALPSLTLNNQLAILAINLKNGSTDITSNITDMTISDGTNTYAVDFSATAGPIYVAIRPTTGATINVTATDGSKNYGKTLATTKTYAAGNGYNVTWNMSEMTTITWNSSNISDLYISGTGDSYSKEGITLSVNADQISAEWQDYGDESMNGLRFNTNENSGGFTFTAPTGQYFTKIEMTLIGQGGWDGANLGTGWAYAEDFDDMIMDMIRKVTWTGTAATTVDLLTGASHFHGENVKSIVFTVY
ncbi:MAG: hypothetical protein IJQ49_03165 [Prevotella sp.]|nr:hypothetical protein [Prevotella sp.]